jgi:glycosyltransferase involved in cell wall biosynthesis
LSKARIGHFIETEVAGGAEQVLIDLARYANSETHDFYPVVLHFGHPWIAHQCEKYGIEHLVIPFRNNFKSTVRLPLFALEFGFWLRKQKIDLLHSHLFGPVTGGALGAKVAGIPHVGTLHDVYMIEEKPARIYLIGLAALLGTKLVTVSKNMEGFYRKRGRFKADRIQTIYNGIDSPDALLTPDNTSSPLSIICVGRLVALKNVNLVIQATIALARSQDLQLFILGEGPERERLESEIPSDQKGRVHFLGVSDDVPSWLRQSDIFVQFSSTEGLSRSIIEAIAAGLPAIVSDVGGNREIVEDGYNGFVLPAGNVEALEATVEKLANDKALRKTMGEHGKQRAKDLFSRTLNNDQYIHLYRELLFL